LGNIENLGSCGIKDESVDVVISNCVLNLCAKKEDAFKEIWRVLKWGGELYFSDVYSDRRIPEHLQNDKTLWGECLSGALYIQDFRRIM
jgi:arsenite methyltransferase